MLEVVPARYDDALHAAALIALMDIYARDPAGGSQALGEVARTQLVGALASRPFIFSVLAFDAGAPVGLINAIEGFSTFACRPLVNIHDVVVAPTHRGRGVATAMFGEVERIARERGACKLTLEVLDGNHAARALYRRLDFSDYQLDPALGHARFLHKPLD